MKKLITLMLVLAMTAGASAQQKTESDVVKAPEHIVPLCVIVIGHPADVPTPKDKWKPENVSYDNFGEKAK